jgi:excisionase family DNA binding protein
MGQQMAQALAAGQAQPPSTASNAAPAAAAASSAALPDLMSPADAAKALGVSENDVVAALTEGSLKGKKIGTAWRITKSALEDFLKS